MTLDSSLGDPVAPGDVLCGKYRVARLIGKGGMGVVVEAWHVQLEERVAIKLLHAEMGKSPEALKRFEREARAAFKIRSEHVARVLDVGALGSGAPYLVMEYLDGVDLAGLLERRQRLPVAEAVDYLLQACEAVAEAHTLGIVHRDLKPENLFLTTAPDGSACIKVLDFGLSKVAAAHSDSRQHALTARSQVVGTPRYMSPEQWMDARNVGTATDIWALGAILYELVTAAAPFDEPSLAQLCTAVLKREPVPLRERLAHVPPRLEEAVTRCLCKEPERRYRDVGALAVVIGALGSSQASRSVHRILGVLRAATGADEQDRSAAPMTLGGTRVMTDDNDDALLADTRARIAAAEEEAVRQAELTRAEAAAGTPSAAAASGADDEPPPTARLPRVGAHAEPPTAPDAADERVAAVPPDAPVAAAARPALAAIAARPTENTWQSPVAGPPRRSRAGLWAVVGLAALGATAGAWWLGPRLFAGGAQAAGSEGRSAAATGTTSAAGETPTASSSAGGATETTTAAGAAGSPSGGAVDPTATATSATIAASAASAGAAPPARRPPQRPMVQSSAHGTSSRRPPDNLFDRR